MRIKPTGPALSLIFFNSIYTVLTVLVVALRLAVRFKMRTIGLDDYLMFVGFAMSLFTNIALFVSINYGVGAHAYRLSAYEDMQARKWFLFASIAYTITVLPIKASICVQLLRITNGVRRIYAYILYSVIVLTVCGMIVRLSVWTTRCKPFATLWNPALGHCQPARIFLNVTYFFSAICIVTDWVCALLPIFLLWKVQLSLRTKLQIGVILSLGVFASIATCVRFRYFITYVTQKDYLYAIANLSTCSQTETTLGIIAGSLPALRPLFRSVPLFSNSYGASRKRIGERSLSYNLQNLHYSRNQRKSEGLNVVNHMGHAIHVTGGKDVERDERDDSASQTHILSEEGCDILMETRVEVKSEIETSSHDSDRR